MVNALDCHLQPRQCYTNEASIGSAEFMAALKL